MPLLPILATLAAAVAASPAEPLALAPEIAGPSVHQEAMQRHRVVVPLPRVIPDLTPAPGPGPQRGLVYGYYPFWKHDLTSIRWSALTHLAWFGVELSAAGDIVDLHGWPDQAVVDVAHANGVRVDLTFTLFGAKSIEALCTSPSRRRVAIENIVEQLEAGGADGISVDFELVNGATREAFVAFIQELRDELDRSGHQGAEISIAGPPVDHAGGIDLAALLGPADWFFVMGYGYFWSGSSYAGPTGMLRVTDDWASRQPYSMLRTIATYTQQLSAEQRLQLIWGVPYYGREWQTEDASLGAATVRSVGAVTYAQAMVDLASGAVQQNWHEGIKTPWYAWQEGSSHRQVYYDDARSLAAKYELAFAQGLGGVGMWALNFDAPHKELWDQLDDTMSQPTELPEGHRLNPIAIASFPFHSERNTADGPSHYFNHYSCAPDVHEFGREWVYQLDVCQAGTVLASVPAYPDRDPDIHLLSEAREDACLARAHTDLEIAVVPGRYLLTVDTFVDMPIEREGPYALDVDFLPDAGSQPCSDGLRCERGACVCADPAHSLCAGSCVDLQGDTSDCGACGRSCGAGVRCVAGRCELDGEPGAETPSEVSDALPVEADSGAATVGCGCRLAARPALDWRLLGLGLSMLVARRRLRRGARRMVEDSALFTSPPCR